MNAAEYRQMTTPERENVLQESRKKLLDLRCRQAVGEEINSAELKETKKEIARLLTVMNEPQAEATGGQA